MMPAWEGRGLETWPCPGRQPGRDGPRSKVRVLGLQQSEHQEGASRGQRRKNKQTGQGGRGRHFRRPRQAASGQDTPTSFPALTALLATSMPSPERGQAPLYSHAWLKGVNDLKARRPLATDQKEEWEALGRQTRLKTLMAGGPAWGGPARRFGCVLNGWRQKAPSPSSNERASCPGPWLLTPQFDKKKKLF